MRVLPGLIALGGVLLAFSAGEARAEPDLERARVDGAVDRALAWLAEQQRPSGAWAVESIGESTAGTSLAIMAYLAAGYLPGEGPYGERINGGIDWLVSRQHPDGMLIDQRSHGPMYSHGISTLMLAEVAGMVDETRADAVRQALERAVRLILMSQAVGKPDRHAGGWRYSPTSNDSDLSVTGWQLMALRAAKNIGCDVPADSIDRAVAYVKKCSVSGNRGFGYMPGDGATPTRNGTGILALEICGEHHTEEALGAANALLERPLRYTDSYFFYGAYYGTIGMFQVGGRHWDETKTQTFEVLLSNQSADGSWASKGSEERYGRVYSTSLAVLALAVEYQFLPIYQR